MSISPEKLFGPLLKKISGADGTLPDAPCITDSRQVIPGCIFAAIPGTRNDGSSYIAEAMSRGAAAIIHQQTALQLPANILSCQVSDARSAVSLYHRHRAGTPDKKLHIYALTGTNGKTTGAYLLRHLLNAAQRPCGLVSTVEYHNGRDSMLPTHTTPDPQTLFPLLATMSENGMQCAAMEFSSHALAQNRLAGVQIKGAIFTNLTGDHMDFHGDMESYYQAKKSLFTDYLVSGGIAAINIDDPAGKRLAEELSAERSDLKIPTFGVSESAGWRISDMQSTADGCTFVLSNAEQAYQTSFPLAGEYNIRNLAGVLTLLLCDGITPDAVNTALTTPLTIPGRLEKLSAPNGATFFVDYAHTDDALRNVLSTLKKCCPGNLTVVFGAGGNRDKSKRPRMGAAAAEYADNIIITSDNPRDENPLEIMADIISGIPEKHSYRAFSDRKEALQYAVAAAQAKDIVLIAGKGHENYQEINGIKHHFDDREILLSLFGDIK